MSVSEKTKKLLFAKAAHRCSKCNTELLMSSDHSEDFSYIGEICHIIAQKPDGPRGDINFDVSKIDEYDNLILLCSKCHKLIDDLPNDYTIERIKEIKTNHEKRVSSLLDSSEVVESKVGNVKLTSLEMLEEAFSTSAIAFQVKRITLDEIKATCEKINSLEILSKNAYLTPDELAEYMANCLTLSSESLNLFAFGCLEGELTYSKVWAEALTYLTDCIAPTRTIDEIRLFPALLHFYAGGIGAVAGEKFENLSSLINQTKIRTNRGKTTNPSHSLVPYRVIKEDEAKKLPNFGRYHTPLNQYLFVFLRDSLQTIIANDQAYNEAFYRFEYLFALSSASELHKIGWGYNVPVGSYAWETYLMDVHSSGVQFVTKQTDKEIEEIGEKWQPFQAGVFGDSWENFVELKKNADESVIKVVQRFFHMFNP